MMTKTKILTPLVGAAALTLAMSGPASAASCWCSPWDYFQQIDCGSAPVGGHLSVNRGSGDRLYVEGQVNDGGSGAPHNWDWRFKHNGDTSFSGSGSGDMQLDKIMVNFVGAPDFVEFVVDSNQRTIHCHQGINVYGS